MKHSKVLSLILAMAVVFTTIIVPASAFAEGAVTATCTNPTVDGENRSVSVSVSGASLDDLKLVSLETGAEVTFTVNGGKIEFTDTLANVGGEYALLSADGEVLDTFAFPAGLGVKKIRDEDLTKYSNTTYISPTANVATWNLTSNGYWGASLERGYLGQDAGYAGVGIIDGTLIIYRLQRGEPAGNMVGATLKLGATYSNEFTAEFKMANYNDSETLNGQSAVNGTVTVADQSGFIFGIENTHAFGVYSDGYVYVFKDGVEAYTAENKTTLQITDSRTNFKNFNPQ